MANATQSRLRLFETVTTVSDRMAHTRQARSSQWQAEEEAQAILLDLHLPRLRQGFYSPSTLEYAGSCKFPVCDKAFTLRAPGVRWLM